MLLGLCTCHSIKPRGDFRSMSIRCSTVTAMQANFKMLSSQSGQDQKARVEHTWLHLLTSMQVYVQLLHLAAALLGDQMQTPSLKPEPVFRMHLSHSNAQMQLCVTLYLAV